MRFVRGWRVFKCLDIAGKTWKDSEGHEETSRYQAVA